MRRFLLLPLALGLLMLPSCKIKEMIDSASGHESTSKVIEEASKDKYTPPADGRLTDSQVQMYLNVKKREVEIAKAAKDQINQDAQANQNQPSSVAGVVHQFHALGSVADFVMADVRAAQELHYNTAEYLWVKTQIIRASSSVITGKIQQASDAALGSTYQNIKKQYDNASDPTVKQQLGTMLSGFKDAQKNRIGQPSDAANDYNIQLLSKYGDAVNPMTNELSKYEDHNGDAQKQMQQMEQGLNQAIAAAKK